MSTNAPALQFNKIFGKTAPAAAAATAQDDRPKAQYWLNIGYQADGVIEGEDTPRFISLPVGIPLDTMETLPTNSRNQVYALQQAARNDLMAQLIDHAQGLEPGQSTIVNLQIELRRVNEDAGPVDASHSPFARKLSL